MLVSGGADSVITFWEDVTEAEELEKIAQHENTVLKYVPSSSSLSSRWREADEDRSAGNKISRII